MSASAWCHCFKASLCQAPGDPQGLTQPLSSWAGLIGTNITGWGGVVFSFLHLFVLSMIRKKDNSAWILCFKDFNNTQEIGWPGASASEGSCPHVDRAGGRGRVKGGKEEDHRAQSFQRILQCCPSPWFCLSENHAWDHHKICDIWELALSPAQSL